MEHRPEQLSDRPADSVGCVVSSSLACELPNGNLLPLSACGEMRHAGGAGMQQTTTSHSARDAGGAIAAVAGTVSLVGSLAVGVQVMMAVGASGLVEAGGDNRLIEHKQLLTAAEILKFISAVTAAWIAASMNQRSKVLVGKGNRFALATGLSSAALLLASAVTGLAPLYLGIGDPATITSIAHGLGLASVAANGTWAGIIVLLAWQERTLPRWLCFTGGMLAIASLAIVALPPVGLLTAVLGCVWLIGLAITFMKS